MKNNKNHYILFVVGLNMMITLLLVCGGVFFYFYMMAQIKYMLGTDVTLSVWGSTWILILCIFLLAASFILIAFFRRIEHGGLLLGIFRGMGARSLKRQSLLMVIIRIAIGLILLNVILNLMDNSLLYI